MKLEVGKVYRWDTRTNSDWCDVLVLEIDGVYLTGRVVDASHDYSSFIGEIYADWLVDWKGWQ